MQLGMRALPVMTPLIWLMAVMAVVGGNFPGQNTFNNLLALQGWRRIIYKQTRIVGSAFAVKYIFPYDIKYNIIGSQKVRFN